MGYYGYWYVKFPPRNINTLDQGFTKLYSLTAGTYSIVAYHSGNWLSISDLGLTYDADGNQILTFKYNWWWDLGKGPFFDIYINGFVNPPDQRVISPVTVSFTDQGQNL